MNPTIADAKKALGLTSDAALARFLGLPRQSMTGRDESSQMPDAWCWRAVRKRPDKFLPPEVDSAAVQGVEQGFTKRALMQRLALTNDTSLAVLLQLPRETVEEWADDAIVPTSPRLHALLADAPPAAASQAPVDPDAARIVPVETA